ncbi:ATP-binding protein [Spirulina sp. 06S082]|uniref:sensor histidine kinase n=1 Tax=Spirulina sp. 06S082 TaxID=3110248 RepID=UPI002B207D6F|nr:ATP-binding protein [Spirulina sp. 06S082]MEA5471621.1 ATP-binding protein [Spirulina sp. 06S082]
MKKWFANGNLAGISKKIAYANSLAIGISISGTMLGLGIGDYYQNQAQENLTIAVQQETLLHDLATSILKIRAHPQKLIVSIKDPFWFRYEVGQFETNVNRVETLLVELNKVGDRSGRSAESIEKMSHDYQVTIDAYVGYFEEIWPQVNPLRIPIEKRAETQKRVLASVLEDGTRDIDIQFETLAGKLDQLHQIAKDKQEIANQDLLNAKHLRERIIFTSLLLSIGTAILLSLYTGRKIARPLEVLTKTARKITQDANYDLQVPVKTSDEVGVLADSFNQLIYKVKQQIAQLAEAQYFLEERVEERTQELQITLETLQETQTQLIQTEKMSSLGEMVAGVAHEINNPVNFIHGNITHAQGYLGDLFDLLALYRESYPDLKSEIQDKIEAIDFDFLQSDFPRILTSMRTGTERIKEIVNSLRNFSRLDESEIKDIDLHEGIDSTLIILSSKIKQGIEIIKDYGDLPKISCYPAQLNQVFLNLIVNGIDALLSSEIEPKQITIRTCGTGEEEIQISIKDNGSGIPETILNKIFNPFFTTKPIGQGTGLGLAICYRIIEKHGGKIEVISEVGRGTQFTITLPTRLIINSNYTTPNANSEKLLSKEIELSR